MGAYTVSRTEEATRAEVSRQISKFFGSGKREVEPLAPSSSDGDSGGVAADLLVAAAPPPPMSPTVGHHKLMDAHTLPELDSPLRSCRVKHIGILEKRCV
jgi:hypothetical protein